MKVNILLCDTFPGLLPPYIPSYEWMFTTRFQAIDGETAFHIFEAYDGVLPTTINTDELYLITGSNSGAYQHIPWIEKLQGFICEAHKKRTPMVGICFGHQIIAQALGGKVIKSPKGWGTGIRASQLLTAAAKKQFGGEEMRLFYNHHDQVVNLPQEAERFATSDFCENEGFTVGQHILTFQGHPEYTAPYNRHLILNHADDEDEKVKTHALRTLDTETEMGEQAMRWMLDFAVR